MTNPEKRTLVEALVARLRADLDAMERAQRATVAGAISEEAKSEHAKDTRALEQTYLARGQARRVADLRAGIARVLAMPIREFEADAAIAAGALVSIEAEEGASVLFVAPFGGGLRLERGEQVVTPASPLGRALIGRRAGDDCELVLDGRTRVFSIRSVA